VYVLAYQSQNENVNKPNSYAFKHILDTILASYILSESRC